MVMLTSEGSGLASPENERFPHRLPPSGQWMMIMITMIIIMIMLMIMIIMIIDLHPHSPYVFSEVHLELDNLDKNTDDDDIQVLQENIPNISDIPKFLNNQMLTEGRRYFCIQVFVFVQLNAEVRGYYCLQVFSQSWIQDFEG